MINNNKDIEEMDKMLDYIEHAIRYANGGPYCDEEYKKQCLEFFENLIDAVLP